MVIFDPSVLSNPRLHCYFTYFFDPLTLKITSLMFAPSLIFMF